MSTQDPQLCHPDRPRRAGRLEKLGMHVHAALRNGLSEDEIGEVLLHSAIYCGVPAANAAFTVAQRVLADPPAQ
jgi:3-oxoadipate enol-lactonase / 4-carboxymuconolactone decarboxylase